MSISKTEELIPAIELMKELLLATPDPDRLHIIAEALSQINSGKATLSIAGCDEWDIRIEYRKQTIGETS